MKTNIYMVMDNDRLNKELNYLEEYLKSSNYLNSQVKMDCLKRVSMINYEIMKRGEGK